MQNKLLLTHSFGNSGRKVTIVGLGGEGILRTHGQERAAQNVIETALDGGITYFDSARAYAGSETYYGLVWPWRPTERVRIFQTSKSAMRTKKEALLELEHTLRNMRKFFMDDLTGKVAVVTGIGCRLVEIKSLKICSDAYLKFIKERNGS